MTLCACINCIAYFLSTDSGVFSSLGSSLTNSDDHIINRQVYHTYQPIYGMKTICRAMAYSTHRVTLNRFGGVTFESVSSGTVTPIGNITQMTVKLKTMHGKISSQSWHELHIGGWAIILPDDTEAERWMCDLDDIPGGMYVCMIRHILTIISYKCILTVAACMRSCSSLNEHACKVHICSTNPMHALLICELHCYLNSASL